MHASVDKEDMSLSFTVVSKRELKNQEKKILLSTIKNHRSRAGKGIRILQTTQERD